MGRAWYSLGSAASLVVVACSATEPVESSSPGPVHPTSAPSKSAVALADEPPLPIEMPSGRCAALGPAARSPPEGPIFALVDDVGLVEIDAEGGRVRIAAAADHSYSDMAIDAAGALWIGGWADADLLRVDSSETRLSLFRRDGPLLHTIAPRGPSDVWLVTRDIEWFVAHYDGKRLRRDRKRAEFARASGYDDNKLNGFARVDDTIYVACWNGLWRRDVAGWTPLDPPAELKHDAIPWDVFAAPDGVVVQFDRASYLLDDDGWGERAMSTTIRDVNVDGLMVSAAPVDAQYRFTLGSVSDPSCSVPSVPLSARYLYDVAVDRRGRIWAATDSGLSVIGPDGTLAAHWGFGELVGLDAGIERLVVVGGGPATLPPPVSAPAWTLEGRLRFSRGGRPVAGRSVLLCSRGFIDDRCAKAPFARSATTEPDGSFRFVAVPPGDLAFVVVHPEDTPECESPFVVEPHYVSPKVDCSDSSPTCDLGELSECQAFEMPPPR